MEGSIQENVKEKFRNFSKADRKKNIKRKKSLRNRLILIFSLLVLIPVVLVSYVLYLEMEETVELRLFREQKEATGRVISFLEDAELEAESTINAVTNAPEIGQLGQDAPAAQLNRSMELVKESLTYVSDIFVYQPGMNNVSTLSEENLYLSANAWFDGAMQTDEEIYVSDTYIDKETEATTMAVIRQVPNQDLVVGVTLDLQNISDFVDSKQIGRTGYPFVISNKGFRQLTSNLELNGQDVSDQSIFLDATGESGELFNDLNNRSFPIYYENVEQLGLTVYGTVSADEMANENQMFLNRVVIVLFITLILAVIIGWLVSQYVVSITRTIQQALYKLEHGDMTARIYAFNYDLFGKDKKKTRKHCLKNKRKKRIWILTEMNYIRLPLVLTRQLVHLTKSFI